MKRWGQAIVVGGGIAGLLFARVLSSCCTRVVVVERDAQPQHSEPRSGVPQGRHLHALLAGGCRAMETMLPGLMADICAAGAIEVIVGWSGRVEIPGHDPFPRRNLGFASYSLSRPLLELCVRRRVHALPNVAFEYAASVEQLLHHEGAVNGVRLRDARCIHGDLVIDASGRGELTLRVLDELGLVRPRQTNIGVDINYATALFKIPDDADHDWKTVITLPKPPEDSRGALMATIEGGRWICAVGWRGTEPAPFDRESYVEWTGQLRTQTVHNAIKDAAMIGDVMRFAFNESYYRHYAELEVWPRGLVPVADAICRFNPIYGQGMSVAALEAEAFGELAADAELVTDGLARRFLKRCDHIIEGPWTMAALPDFAYPDTRGERPAQLLDLLRFNQAFTELAAHDADVHRLMQEIRGLLKPRSALSGNPALMQRIYEVMKQDCTVRGN